MTLINTQLAHRLREGETVLGLFLNIPSPALAEMAGLAEFDFIVVDNEHGPAGIETTEQLLRAAGAAAIPPIVRVSSHRADEILRTLDVGAAGVQVPHVNTSAQAAGVVKAAKYPPQGTRGVAFSTRAAGFGFLGGLDHVRRSNEETLVVSHIETHQAVKNLDSLLRVKGIDVHFIGPNDLSFSMGYGGRPNHPEVQKTVIDCIERIAAAGAVPGVAVQGSADFRRLSEVGARYLTITAGALIGNSLKAFVTGARGGPGGTT